MYNVSYLGFVSGKVAGFLGIADDALRIPVCCGFDDHDVLVHEIRIEATTGSKVQ